MRNTVFILCSMLAANVSGQETFTLKSNDLGGEATITEEFNGFGCTGKNQSPQLSWSNAPEGHRHTRSAWCDLVVGIGRFTSGTSPYSTVPVPRHISFDPRLCLNP